jgi:tRNA (cmo5U34)-methyltransferase
VSVTEWEWDPDTYLAEMADEIPGYEELQEAVAAATADARATRVLELGTGSGETALRVLANQAGVGWVGIDASEPMLGRARERLPGADLRLQRLEDELPSRPFDLVVSALAVHHLDGAGKQGLFSRAAGVLEPGGKFVLGDVVVPAAGKKGRSTSTG